MSDKVVIFGKNSFLGNHLFNFFKKKKIDVKLVSFSNFSKVKYNNVKYLINCSFHIGYLKQYKKCYDRDLKIAEYIKNLDINYFFLSSGKVYGNYNRPIKEHDNCNPKSTYAKNKLITEKKLKKILGKKLIIFRISNIIGQNLRKKKSLNFFFNIMLSSLINKNIIELPEKKYFKDFLPIKDFCYLVYKSIKLKLPSGIYNLSSGIGLDLNKVARSIIKGYGSGEVSFFKKSTDNYILDSSKLYNKIKFSIKRKYLLTEIYYLGRSMKNA
jgi:nucleoside-diphosphate-sugar epimerase